MTETQDNKKPATLQSISSALTKDTRITVGLALMLLVGGLSVAGAGYKMYDKLNTRISQAEANAFMQITLLKESQIEQITSIQQSQSEQIASLEKSHREQMLDLKTYHRDQISLLRTEQSTKTREISDSLRDLTAEIKRQNDAAERRMNDIESGARKTATTMWTSYMMELYVAQCLREGKFVDPAPIIERYSNGGD